MSEAPRRCYLQKNTPAELAVRAAMKAVEEAGCDVLLTDAVVLLEQALNKVGDYVDRKQRPPLSEGECPACYGREHTHYRTCARKKWDPTLTEPYMDEVSVDCNAADTQGRVITQAQYDAVATGR